MFKYEDNVFTKILNGEIKTDIILENQYFISFHDINPSADLHILIIPKKHYVNYHHFLTESSLDEREQLQEITKELVKKFQLKDFKVLTNNGAKAGQIVFHFHVHLMGYK